MSKQIPVLEARAGQKPVFRVYRDGDKEWRLVGWDLINDKPADRPSDTILPDINRILESSAAARPEGTYEDYFRREPPLVLEPLAASPPPDAKPSPSEPLYLLEADETILSAHTQTVDLLLRRLDVPASPQLRRVLIIDRAPLLIAQVQFTDYLADLAAGITNEIANFSTRRDAVWEITAGARGFTLMLPPQSVGEAMEKFRNKDNSSNPRDVEEDKIISYRFYAPKDAKFRMDDERVEELLRKDKQRHKHTLYKWLDESQPSVGQKLYETFPLPVRLALLDMVYNLGLPRLKKYKKLRASVVQRQWAQAADRCHRRGPPEDRNVFTKELFQAAAALDPALPLPLP